jgi:hypothetical protein
MSDVEIVTLVVSIISVETKVLWKMKVGVLPKYIYKQKDKKLRAKKEFLTYQVKIFVYDRFQIIVSIVDSFAFSI